MQNKHNIVIRFAAIFFLVALGFLGVLAQILHIQISEREQWLNIAKGQIAVEKPIAPMRGNIYDCEGRLLVGSLPKYTLTMDTRVEALHLGGDTLFYNNLDSVCRGLSRIFQDKSPQQYRQMLTNAFLRKDGRLKLQPRAVDYTQMKAVKQLPIFCKGRIKSGLIIEESHQRVRPFGSLAGRTLGNIYADTGEGNSGLEKRYNDLLKGKEGRSQRQRIAGKYENVVIKEAENGYDLVTTINADMQDVVESMLRQRIELIEGEWGCCILMEVKTGEIKAICNLDRTASGQYMEMMNHAVTRVEPGSTFKTVSLMAALDDGKIHYETDSFEVYQSGWKYSDAVIRDAHPRDTVYCVRDAMAASSNIALAKIVTQSYEKKADKFTERLMRLGIADSIPCEIPGAQVPKLGKPSDATTLAKMSYGYSVEFSPLQMLTFYNGIANNGKMISPIIVKEIQHSGKTVKRFETNVIKANLCKASTLEHIQECLHAVVWDNQLGTAAPFWGQKKAQSDIVHIAGKTGTAQILENGRYTNQAHRIAFVGYFPEEDPQYSCICVIHHPHTAKDAGRDCGGVVRLVAERVMASVGTMDSELMQLPYDSIDKPKVKGGQQDKIKTAVKSVKLSINKVDSEWAKVDNNLQSVALSVKRNEVPNVIGMGARDAVFAIEQTGMKAQLSGKGRVVRQSVAAGQSIVKGGVVYLELR